MNAVDRLVGYFSPAAGLRRAQDRQQLASVSRSYEAARPNRATAGWRRPATSARSETYVALRELKAGSHDTVRNNPHGANVVTHKQAIEIANEYPPFSPERWVFSLSGRSGLSV